MATITISLPESLRNFVDAQLADKGFDNVSEYFRSLLRTARKEAEDARIEKLLLEGLNSGPGIPVTQAFWDGLKADAKRIRDGHKSRKNTK